MSATDASKPSNVTATLRYLKWEKLYESQRPYQIYCPTEDTAIPKSNLSFEDGPEELIHDARHAEESFDLDRNGFTFVEYEYNPAWFTQPNLIEKYYLPVISRLVEKALGGKIVVQILEYQIRKNKPITAQNGIVDLNDKTTHILPSQHVHLDYDPTVIPQLVRYFMADKAAALLKGRVRVINAWQPLVDTVFDQPLAICDGSTIKQMDLVAADHITVDHHIINSFGLYSTSYKWWYLHKQRRNEVILFKNFDSDENVQARCCLHTSFSHPEYIPTMGLPRESIEVRALVFS